MLRLLADTTVILRLLLAFALVGVAVIVPEHALVPAIALVTASGVVATIGVFAAGRAGLGTMGALFAPSAGAFFHLTVYFTLATNIPAITATPIPVWVPLLILGAEAASSSVRLFARQLGHRPHATVLPLIASLTQWGCALCALLAADDSTAQAACWIAAGVSASVITIHVFLNRRHIANSLRVEKGQEGVEEAKSE